MVVSIVFGVVCGLVGSLPLAILFEGNLRMGRRVSMGVGIVAVICSFAFLSAAIAVAYAITGDGVLSFVVSMLVTYLVFWGIETARAWHRIAAKR